MSVSFVRRSANRWSPTATRIIQTRQFSEAQNHLPWPFDKYKAPAAAKKWVSKYPLKDTKFEEEYLYLDEIEARISGHYKTQRQSQRFRDAQNEFGVLGDYDDMDKVYPTLDDGGQANQFGRGALLNPAHYVLCQYLQVSRIYVENDRIKPRWLLKNRGQLGNTLSVPPEESSLFRFWNFWHMFAAGFIISVGKEVLILSSHDTHHFFLYFLTTGWIGSIFVDWYLWWKALRGQEYYDQRFFPLQENVDNLFTLLDRLEKKPDLAIISSGYHSYVDEIRTRLVTRRVADEVALKANAINDKLDTKFRGEQAQSLAPSKVWVSSAIDSTMTFFQAQAQRDTYSKNAMAAFLKDGAKLSESKNKSAVVQNKYKTVLNATKKQWYDDHRKAGTLPWTHATPEEIAAKTLSAADIKSVYEETVKGLASKYHKV